MYLTCKFCKIAVACSSIQERLGQPRFTLRTHVAISFICVPFIGTRAVSERIVEILVPQSIHTEIFGG